MLSAFWLDRLAEQARTLVVVRGRDAHRFVQGMISADLRTVVRGEGKPAALLTIKGKMISDAIVLILHDDPAAAIYGLAVPSSIAGEIELKLRKHAIMDDVEIAVDPATVFVVVRGDSATLDFCGLAHARVEHPLRGELIWGERAALQRCVDTLNVGDDADFNALRIADEQPAWGYELRADVFPPEVGFVQAVSYEKGCYLGQEPLARIHARGQTNWVMAKVRAAANAKIQPTALSASDRPQAGNVTTLSPRFNTGEGLAIVHRKVASAGTLLTNADAPTEQWEVISGPLGADLRR